MIAVLVSLRGPVRLCRCLLITKMKLKKQRMASCAGWSSTNHSELKTKIHAQGQQMSQASCPSKALKSDKTQGDNQTSQRCQAMPCVVVCLCENPKRASLKREQQCTHETHLQLQLHAARSATSSCRPCISCAAYIHISEFYSMPV